MALGAVAGGAQSLAYWMYPDGTQTRGPATNPELWHAMGRVNGELATAAHLLAKSYPVDSAIVKVPERVIAQVLRTVDDEATMLVLLNKHCRSQADGMQVGRIVGFEVSLFLPPGAQAVSVCRLSADGPVGIDAFNAGQDSMTFRVKHLAEGDVYVVAHSREAMERIRSIYSNSVRPNNERASQLFHAGVDGVE